MTGEESVKQVQKTVDIPTGLRSYFDGNPDVLKVLVDSAPQVDVKVQPEKNWLLISGPLSCSVESVEKLAKDYVELANVQLAPAMKLLTETKEKHVGSVAYEEFAVPSSQMSLVIGPRGANIIAARTLDGVIRIDNTERFVRSKGIQLFKVIAKNIEIAKTARHMLEFVRVAVPVPQVFTGRVIGKNGVTIQSIVDKSTVLRVNIDPESAGSQDVKFFFTGTSSSVEMARAMVNLHVQLARDMVKIRNEMDALRFESNRQKKLNQTDAAAAADDAKEVVQPNKTEKKPTDDKAEKPTDDKAEKPTDKPATEEKKSSSSK